MTRLRSLWVSFVAWFETGDLVPLLVIVSAVHYAAVLSARDTWPVAIAIGLLVDLGHYRTIRAAVRYSGASRYQALARWLIAAGMTGLSLNYHQRYYEDWWLSAPLPLLIAALAWLQQIDKRQRAEPARSQADDSQLALAAPSKEPARKPLYLCSCGYQAGSQAGLNGHKRKHSARALLERTTTR
jgi:hypothetical protein